MSHTPPHEQRLQSRGSDFHQMRARNVTVKIMAFVVPPPSGSGSSSSSERSPRSDGSGRVDASDRRVRVDGNEGRTRADEVEGRVRVGTFSLGKRKTREADRESAWDMGFLKAFPVTWVV